MPASHRSAPAGSARKGSVSNQSAFGGLLLLAMGVSTFTASSLGILATFVIDDLAISRAELGAVIAVINIGAAVTSPTVGRMTDAVGGRRAFIGVYTASGLAFVLLAAAPFYVVLFAGAVVAALAQAGANPSTNKLIALHLPLGKRGVITGIKQSGVQAAIFAGGLVLPAAAETVGWRPTLAAVAGLCLLAVPVILAVVPSDRPGAPAGTAESASGPMPPAVRRLTAYGFLLGLSGSVTFLVPLFAEEALGFDPRIGGVAAAVTGLAAFAGRIGWAHLAERRHAYVPVLGVMAVLAVVAPAVYLASERWFPGLLLMVAAALTGLGSSSWNSVGMLAVMNEAGAEGAGRASGVVMLGFLTGLGIGPPAFGRIVDATGVYTPMWVVSLGVSVIAVALTFWWWRDTR